MQYHSVYCVRGTVKERLSGELGEKRKVEASNPTARPVSLPCLGIHVLIYIPIIQLNENSFWTLFMKLVSFPKSLYLYNLARLCAIG